MSVKILENHIWTLVEPEDVCIDKDEDKNPAFTKAVSVYECAKKCSATSSHFAYGTNDFGGHGCTRGLCDCYCIQKCVALDQEKYLFFMYKSTFDFHTISESLYHFKNQ